VDLQIEQREAEGIVILDLKGRLVLGRGDLELRQRLEALLEDGQKNVALNLKEVTEMDSSALGALIFGSMKFHEAAGKLVLINLSLLHNQLSNMVKLNTAFEIYRDEATALNSFFPERAVPHYDILEFVEEMEQCRRNADFETSKGNGQPNRESPKKSN
jgi:anti-sigma B factor antagonist